MSIYCFFKDFHRKLLFYNDHFCINFIANIDAFLRIVDQLSFQRFIRSKNFQIADAAQFNQSSSFAFIVSFFDAASFLWLRLAPCLQGCSDSTSFAQMATFFEQHLSSMIGDFQLRLAPRALFKEQTKQIMIQIISCSITMFQKAIPSRNTLFTLLYILYLQYEQVEYSLYYLNISMKSPRSISKLIPKVNKERLSTLPESPSDFQHHSSNNKPSTQHNCIDVQTYYQFKQKLLRSMATHDPLQILNLGIFEDYQNHLGIKSQEKSSSYQNNKQCIKEQVETSDFDNAIHSYVIDQNLRITQVQRKSLSCQKFSKQKNTKRKLEEQRNVQFVIFSNYLQKIRLQNKQKEEFFSAKSMIIADKFQQSYQNIAQKKGQSYSLEFIQQENKEIKQKMTQINVQLQNQKMLTANAITEKNDRQLQFLLKQKMMHKKLLDAKLQIQQLKSTLDMLQQQHSKFQLPLKSKQHQLVASHGQKRSLGFIKQKIQNQSRIKLLLSQLSKAEFQSICQDQK